MPRDQLFATQIELLMRNLATGTVMAHAAGVLVAILLLWNLVKPLLLFSWVGVLFAVLLLRSWHMHYCLDKRAHRVNARRVCWQLIGGVAVTGLCWVTAYIHVASIAPVSIQYIFLLIVVLIAGLSLGPSVVVREYYIAYLLSSLFPIAWWNLVHYWDYPFNVVVGLMLLLATGVLLATANRAGDVVARYGGEEFMVVMPAADIGAARAVAARIQRALEGEDIEHAHSAVAPYVTVSQGLAYAQPEERLSSQELITLADEALYAAKAEGRNAIKAA